MNFTPYFPDTDEKLYGLAAIWYATPPTIIRNGIKITASRITSGDIVALDDDGREFVIDTMCGTINNAKMILHGYFLDNAEPASVDVAHDNNKAPFN